MAVNILNTVYLGLSFLALFGSAEMFFKKFKLPAELTRKYVHIATGIITLLFPALISSHWLVLFLSVSFILILQASIKFNFLNSINGVERVTRGSILFPIVVYMCFFIYKITGQLNHYYLPILILAICDPLAAFVGKRFKLYPFKIAGHSKTFVGCLAFFVSSFLISFVTFYFTCEVNFSLSIFSAFFIAQSSTLAEAISYKGYDNLTIPIAVIVTILLIQTIL